MNVTTLLLMAAVSAGADDEWTTVYSPSAELAQAVRGQTPGYDEDPGFGPSQTVAQYASQPLTYDPFVAQPDGGGVPGDAWGYSFGVNGPQPYRFGWTQRYDAGWIPKADTDSPLGLGQFGVVEFNSEWQYTTPLSPAGGSWIFSVTPQFNYRSWDGPDTGPLPGLASSVFRFGSDFELATPLVGPLSMQLGATPAVASDFEGSLTSKAWNIDARAIAFYRLNPQWLLALGAGVWDRVDTHVIPYAGAVWTPDDRWELRLLFPQSRISYFLGNIDGFAKWLYVSGEYHIEAYEVELQPIGFRDQVELQDWRLLTGLRMEQAGWSMFIEGGVVFGREVEFLRTTAADFDVSTGFIARAGVRY